jgi:hypothetical protein
MLKRIAETISGPDARQIEWRHSRREIVEGVEQVFAAIKKREEQERELLESLWDTIKLLAKLAGGALEIPILLGVAGTFAPFAAIGAGYMAAADEIKRKRASIAFAEGVVMGVMAELPENVRDYFWEHNPTPNPVFPAAGKIAQYYYNGGLVLGYGHGREVFSKDLAGVFWADIKPEMTTVFGDPTAENWGRKEWIDFYTTVAGAFYRRHIRE